MAAPGSVALPGPPPGPRLLPGADRVLAAQAAALPQADAMCGPFAARAALHALGPVLPEPLPTLDDLALACGTRATGTDAPGLCRGVEESTGGAVAVVPAAPGPEAAGSAPLGRLLTALVGGEQVGVIAHLRTGPVVAGGPADGWDVGHFVCVWSLDPPGVARRVGLADSYPSLGRPGLPPGCRTVRLADLDRAMRLPPGRGLLLLVPAPGREAARTMVRRAGLDPRPWST